MLGKSTIAKLMSLALIVLPLGGCQIAGDLVSPGFLAGIGVDPDSVGGLQGRVVVAFNNTTQFDAQFFVVAADADLLTFQEASAEVGGGEAGNAVFNCPVDVLFPGAVTGDANAPAGAAVEVTTPAGIVPVAYAGVLIESGRDYQCGDVVEIRLVQTGQAATAADFNILITIRAGR